jgi:hypothetical protein
MKRNLIQMMIIAVVLLIGITQFQNCSSSLGVGNTNTPSEKLDGGNGYDGKPVQYVIWDNSGQCADRVRDRIEIDSSEGAARAFRTRENCEDIAPKPVLLLSSSLVRYNLANLVAVNKPFDLYRPEGFTSSTGILCRGEVQKRNQNVTVVADVSVTASTVRGYRGHYVLGIYDSTTGDYLSREDGEDVPLVRTVDQDCIGRQCDGNFEVFVHRSVEGKNWRLVLPSKSGDDGQIHLSLSNSEPISAKIPCFRK